VAIYVKCPNPSCAKEYYLRDELAGKAVRCSQCQTIIRVPEKERITVEEGAEVQAAPAPLLAEVKTDPYAIWSLIFGLLIPCCTALTGVPALVLGITSKKRISESKGTLKGDGMATAGIILGIIGIILFVTVIILRLSGNYPAIPPAFRP